MQSLKYGAFAAILGTTALVGLTAAPAMAAPAPLATATNGSETVNVPDPFVIYNSSPGVPSPGQGLVTGSGFTPGALIYLQICNGVSPSTAGYSTAANCTYANGQTVVPASGNISINTNQGSYEYEVFHGEDLNDQSFNCLAPADDPSGTTTVVGNQPIDNTLPSWGSNLPLSTQAGNYPGGKAPCQLRIGYTTSYTSQDIYIPITNLDGSQPNTGPGGSLPESPLTIALPIGAAVVLAGGATFALRRRRRAHATV